MLRLKSNIFPEPRCLRHVSKNHRIAQLAFRKSISQGGQNSDGMGTKYRIDSSQLRFGYSNDIFEQARDISRWPVPQHRVFLPTWTPPSSHLCPSHHSGMCYRTSLFSTGVPILPQTALACGISPTLKTWLPHISSRNRLTALFISVEPTKSDVKTCLLSQNQHIRFGVTFIIRILMGGTVIQGPSFSRHLSKPPVYLFCNWQSPRAFV